MSTDELERYKDLYNQLVVLMVRFHNGNHLFTKRVSLEQTKNLRGIIRQLKNVETEMYKCIRDVYLEAAQNTKERLANQRVERAYKKANPLKRGRRKGQKDTKPRKNQNTNDMDSSRTTS